MTAPPRRVAVLVVSLRSDGGAEALVRTLLHELHGSRYELEVFTFKRVRGESWAEVEQLGAKVEMFPARRLISPRRFAALLRRLHRGGYDVIHTHLVAANIVGLLCGFLLRVPVVVTLHNTETQADRHWYHGRLETFLIRRTAARVIAVGELTARARGEMLGDVDLHVLPNAVSPTAPLSAEERLDIRRSLMTDPSAPLVLSVGRLEAQKAHDDLIAAIQLVRASVPSVELALAGRGSLHGAIETRIAEEGLVGAVHLLGSRLDARRLMRACDVFAMSSHWEGLPVALLEAMEAGAPIVATRVGDVPEVLGDGCGRMVEAGDVEALADAITRTVRDIERGADLSSRCRAAVAERYSSARWAREVADHYEAALSG